jgi:hypothetical protein
MIECTEGLRCLWCVRKLDEPAETAPLLLKICIVVCAMQHPQMEVVYTGRLSFISHAIVHIALYFLSVF